MTPGTIGMLKHLFLF